MWIEVNNGLEKSFEFKDFSEAFAFVTRVAMLAEQQNHHPTFTNTWNKVHLRLSTHESGNTITQRDHRLAQSIDLL